MVLSFPGFVAGTVGGVASTAMRLATGERPETAYISGRESGGKISEFFGSPLHKVFNLFDSGKVYEQTKTVEGMNKFSELVQNADDYWAQKSSGKIPQGAFSQLVDTLLAGAV